MQTNWIQDAAITASSIHDLEHDPGRARLHGNGAWMPLIQSADQFLQIDFGDETNVSAVAIQGHPEKEFWVSKYSLSFSMDAKIWEDHSEVSSMFCVLNREEYFHMTSWQPFWCPKTMKRRPCWGAK